MGNEPNEIDLNSDYPVRQLVTINATMTAIKSRLPVIPENMTKDGVVVKPGQVWRDLDKRMNGRCVRVLSIADGKATVARTNPTTNWTSDNTSKISIRRMYRNSTGWALVSDSN